MNALSCRYHICESVNFKEQINNNGVYFPPTYQQDGFVHATSDPKMLIDIANAFYKSAKGSWICVSLWVHKLNDVRFEAPAPVGNVTREADTKSEIKFPHVYGPITKDSVCTIYEVIRLDDGTFSKICDI